MSKKIVQTTWFVLVALLSLLHAELNGTARAESPKIAGVGRRALSKLQSNPVPFRHSNYSVAWYAAKKSKRPMLLFVSMPRCPHCVRMKTTYKQLEVDMLVSESFETVYVDSATNAKLVKQLKVKRYPTTIVIGTNNKVQDVIEGYVDSKTLQHRLKSDLTAMQVSTQKR